MTGEELHRAGSQYDPGNPLRWLRKVFSPRPEGTTALDRKPYLLLSHQQCSGARHARVLGIVRDAIGIWSNRPDGLQEGLSLRPATPQSNIPGKCLPQGVVDSSRYSLSFALCSLLCFPRHSLPTAVIHDL